MKTQSEKILLAILIAIVVLGGNYYGYQWLSKKQAALELTRAELAADQAEALVDLKNEDDTDKQRAWIEKNEPPMTNKDVVEAQVLNEILKGATDNKLEIIDQKPGTVESNPAGTLVNVSLTVKGPMHPLCIWLADLQKPVNFYAVTRFTLNIDTDDQKAMKCKIEMGRYFKGGS